MAATTAARTPDRHSPFSSAQALHDRSSLAPRTASPALPPPPPPPAAAPVAHSASPVVALPPPASTGGPQAPSSHADDDDEEVSSSDVIIDMETFEQLLELDDEGSYEFCISTTKDFFEQVATAFADMDAALAAKDLKKLSELGHFLKSSSGALGVRKVQNSCEKMQHYGKLHDGRDRKFSEAEALDRITALLARVKREFAEAKAYLIKWYADHGAEL